jgi:hypothetical protein
MLTTGIFETLRFVIPAKMNTTYSLIPIGDIHRDSYNCALEYYQETLKWMRSLPNVLVLGMGDYLDLASTSEREILMNNKLHDGTKDTLEQIYWKNVKTIVKDFEPFKGRIIGMLEGNHYGVFADGTTTTQQICRLLGVKYLGVSAFIQLGFKTNHRNLSVNIWAHHGKGGAQTIGGSINNVEKMGQIADAQIYIMGHDHKKGALPDEKLVLKEGDSGKLKVRYKKIYYVRSGSFLRAYVEGRASYVTDRCLRPAVLGVVRIEMTPKRAHREGEDENYVDLHHSD